MSLAAGETLGSFRLLTELGEGGMGRVYRARHSLIGRDAAIKVLLPRLSGEKELVSRFFNEARAATMIRHPGIIDIFDFGYADDGRAYIVMELLEGMSMAEVLDEQGTLCEAEVIRYTRQVAHALAAAHGVGIIHRDLKPDNMFVVRDADIPGGERVKILDFGIAKLSGSAAGDNLSKTKTGVLLGSPLYMSPEQCAGGSRTDRRSDIYSLGCVMYEMVVGRPPFEGTGIGAIIAKHIYELPTPPGAINPNISRGLSDLIIAMMAKDLDRRPATMDVVAAALCALEDGDTDIEPIVQPRGRRTSSIPPMGDPEEIARYASTVVSESNPSLVSVAAPVAVAIAARAPTQRPHTVTGAVQLRSRSSFWMVPALLALAAAGAAALLYGGANAVARGERASSLAGAATSADESAPAIEAPNANADQPADDAAIAITITSTPRGALVRDADRMLLGETPYTIVVTPDAKNVAQATLWITQLGYEDREIDVSCALDCDHPVVLTRLGEGARRNAARPATRAEARADAEATPRDPPPRATRDTIDPWRVDASGARPAKKKSGFGETIDPLAE